MSAQLQEIRSADGHLIPVWVSGKGRPLLIVHGGATNHRSWEPVRAHLESHATVAVMDRRAITGDPLSELDLTMEFEDVAAVARSFGDDVAVLGHSAGALCTLGASLLLPRLKHLLLYEPPLEEGPHYRSVLPRLHELLRADDIDGVYDVWLKEYVGMPEPVAEAVKSSPVGADNRLFAQYLPREMAAHLNWVFDPKSFSKVTATTVYFTGSETPQDNVQLWGFARMLKDTIPNFSVCEIPGQGHFANFHAPKLLAELVLDSIQIKTRTKS